MSESIFAPDRLYRPREVVALGGVPRELVYSALHAGDLQAIHRGTRYLVPGWCVAEWLKRAAS